jgi:hypothetical protein
MNKKLDLAIVDAIRSIIETTDSTNGWYINHQTYNKIIQLCKK